MSFWTHIVATFDVDTYKKEKNIKEIIEQKLKDAPKITGSESDADVFVNVLSGYNHWIGGDCNICEYKDTVIHLEEGGYTCDAEEGYKCPENTYQTRVVITVIGDLRDRMKETTREEYKSFLKYLKKDCGFEIRNKSVNIVGY